MFERVCLDRWSYNSTACLQKLGDNDSCTALKPRGWLTIYRCVWGRELKNEVRFSHLETLSASNCLVFLVKPTQQPLSYGVI